MFLIKRKTNKIIKESLEIKNSIIEAQSSFYAESFLLKNILAIEIFQQYKLLVMLIILDFQK
jgi:hypothetical protein